MPEKVLGTRGAALRAGRRPTTRPPEVHPTEFTACAFLSRAKGPARRPTYWEPDDGGLALSVGFVLADVIGYGDAGDEFADDVEGEVF